MLEVMYSTIRDALDALCFSLEFARLLNIPEYRTKIYSTSASNDEHDNNRMSGLLISSLFFGQMQNMLQINRSE